VKQDHFSYSGKYYAWTTMCSSQSCFEAAANALRGRRVSRGKRADRREVRRLSYARRSAGARRREIVISATPRTSQSAAAQVRGRRLCRRSRNGTRSSDELRRITDVQQSAAGYATTSNGLPEPNWSSAFPGRLFGFEPWPAVWARRHAGTGGRTTYPIRSRRVDLVLLQFSRSRRNGAFCRCHHSPGFVAGGTA